MDEVDIDAEDYNELEARLYGQIHHEAVAVATGVKDANPNQQPTEPATAAPERIVTATSVVNRAAGASKVPASRYWANNVKNTSFGVAKETINHSNGAATPNKPPAGNNAALNHVVSDGNSVVNSIKANDPPKALSSQPAAGPLPRQPQPTANQQNHQNQNNKNKNAQKSEQQQKQHPTPSKDHSRPDFRINPAAACRNSKAKLLQQQQQHVPRHGPFVQQELKLQKALQIEAKKQKSKKVRAKKKQQQQQNVETIVLQSSEESENDDVIVLPTVPPPTITVHDSDSGEEEKVEEEQESTGQLQLEEENAMDAADVQLDIKTNFSKPDTASKQQVASVSPEQATEANGSRCTSPCSVLSSDDFIGQTDRSRLLERNVAADDQDLLLLTADVDSLMQTPGTKPQQQLQQQGNENSNESPTLGQSKPLNTDDNSCSNDVLCTAEFITPLATAHKAAELAKSKPQADYRVDQSEFRALDVYESESDITDSVYSKGSKKRTTVVRAAGSSSDGDDDVQKSFTQKLKKLRKRRSSSSGNRSADAANGESTDSEAEDDETEGVAKTGVPFISRGPAVERLKHKLRRRARSTSTRRTSGGASGSAGNMSDSEFIATLNSLATGRENNPPDNEADNEEEEKENTDDEEEAQQLTARDIAEQVLGSANENNEASRDDDESSVDSVQIIPPQEPKYADVALPDDMIADLDKVFNTIDNLDNVKPKRHDDEPDDVERYGIDDDIEIITPPVIREKDNQTSEAALCNVVYKYDEDEMGGIGWNEEMRKFYNNSWNGENFTLREVKMRMDRSRNLWRIHSDDRFPKSRPFSNLKCYNCCEFGHTRARCKRPKKPPVCYMCGESGHYEPRCPNTICLRCGNKTQMFTKSCNACTFQNRLICPICKVRGHAVNLCPDKWRRYHSTTDPNDYPNSNVTYNPRKMCCVCGGRGHFSEHCRSAVRFMEYPIIVSQIKSHQKSYSDSLLQPRRDGIAYNLLYKPSMAVCFHLAENTNANKYYGRFLCAVGMGHLLRRKRAANNDGMAVARPQKQAKNCRGPMVAYVPNRQVPAASTADQQAVKIEGNQNAPDQVQEISGSDEQNEDVEMNEEDVAVSISSDEGNAEEEQPQNVDVTNTEPSNVMPVDEAANLEPIDAAATSNSQFKTPNEVPAAHHTNATPEPEALCMDSDSNYSFSEHFEMASPPETTKNASATDNQIENAETEQPSTSSAARQAIKIREMEPLPDFIPLNNMNDDNDNNEADNVDMQSGISRRFITADTDEEDTASNAAEQAPNLPCEAKIYLTQFHSNYLLAPNGHEFLVVKSKECDIKARLDWTSVGHVLIIFGLPENQDKFHQALLVKYRELSDAMQQRSINISKVPKRTDVLIRFLRENINQLLNNLGNVNDLQRRIRQAEESHTKASLKLAEKCRRTLNMILLGQAGLGEGNTHLEKLLASLRMLISDYQSEHTVPNQLRDEIDAHAKLIFTSYRHDNYPQLIEAYNRLMTKNRIPQMNIDPLLLGQRMLDTSLTNEQKERLEKAPMPKTNHSMVPNPLNPNNSKLLNKREESPPPPAPSMRTNSADSSPPPAAPSMKTPTQQKQKGKSPSAMGQNTPARMKKQTLPPPPFVNPEQRSTAMTRVKENSRNVREAFDDLLPGRRNGGMPTTSAPGGGNNVRREGGQAPAKGPSVFWSRESMKYLDECIRLAENNGELLQKLQRIQGKAEGGALSYNDYRAVIKLHGAMIGN